MKYKKYKRGVFFLNGYYLALQGGDQTFLLSVMRSVLESSSIVKVFHDCRGDAQEFRDNLGLDLANIIDTQMMHAFVTVCQWSKCVLLYPANVRLVLNMYINMVSVR
jgi:ribonuclease D